MYVNLLRGSLVKSKVNTEKAWSTRQVWDYYKRRAPIIGRQLQTEWTFVRQRCLLIDRNLQISNRKICSLNEWIRFT